MKKTMLDALNEQMRKELNSAYIYLAMATYFSSRNLDGMAKWMKAQYSEEFAHAMKFYSFILERGEVPVIPAIDKPNASYDSITQVFENALKHEKFISESINEVYDIAVKEDDKPAQIMLQWFITEQVEEEDSVGAIVDTLKMVGESGQALFMLDRQLGMREGH